MLSIIAVLLIVGFLILELFVVETVEVEGNETYDSASITEWVLNDSYSWNTLYVLLKYKFGDTQEVPFIDTMEVTMVDRNTLHVTVYEKGLIGYTYIESLGQNAYFDKDGFVVELSETVMEDVPEIQGLSCESAVLYEKLDISSATLKKLLTLTQMLSKYEIVVSEITYSSLGDMELIYGGITIELGSDEYLTEKMVRLQKILPQLEGQTGILHLENWSTDTTDVTFEKTE